MKAEVTEKYFLITLEKMRNRLSSLPLKRLTAKTSEYKSEQRTWGVNIKDIAISILKTPVHTLTKCQQDISIIRNITLKVI